jgi:phosphatidylserine decarboxylase
MASRIPVASEGWPFIAIPAAIAAGLALTGRRRLALPFAGAALASLGFFRDPERAIPWIPGGILSPADGRVTSVDEAIDDFVGPAVRVSIFLSPVDVHVNRAPVAGRVVATRYRPGQFVAAYKPEAGDVNECMTVHIEGERARVTVMQIAGVVARRIVCRVSEGDKLEAGQRFGMIRFGSRTDCYMPHGTLVRVQPGEKVVGGMTIIGELA